MPTSAPPQRKQNRLRLSKTFVTATLPNLPEYKGKFFFPVIEIANGGFDKTDPTKVRIVYFVDLFLGQENSKVYTYKGSFQMIQLLASKDLDAFYRKLTNNNMNDAIIQVPVFLKRFIAKIAQIVNNPSLKNEGTSGVIINIVNYIVPAF